MQFNCMQSNSGDLGKGQGKYREEVFREGTEGEGAERDVSEKGVYCLTRPFGLNCPNLPKKYLKTNNSHHPPHG